MKINKIIQNELLIVSLDGRLDAAGSIELENFLEDCQNSHEFISLLLDMSKVNYLSSAGLRILTIYSKKANKEKGKLAICSLQSFCAEVLKLTGLQKAFDIFDTLQEAKHYCLPKPSAIPNSTKVDQSNENIESGCGCYSFSSISKTPGRLIITGEYTDILHSRLNRQLIHGRKFSELKYSLGVGSLGSTPAEYMNSIGNMLTVDNALFWNASNTGNSDYLVPAEDVAGNILVQTGFNTSFVSEFNECIKFSSSDMMGSEIKDIYTDLLNLSAIKNPNFKGIIWCSMIAFAGGVLGQTLKKSPLHENRPKNEKVINHPSNSTEWLKSDQLAEQRDCVCLISGVGIDLMRDLSDYSEMMLDRIFYMNPANLGGRSSLVMNNAAVFNNAKYNNKADDFEVECKRISNEAEFVRACSLQDKTHIKDAIIMLSYIDHLEQPEQLDSMYARTLEYKLNRNNALLQTYHLNNKK